jgi:hypothetical protein
MARQAVSLVMSIVECGSGRDCSGRSCLHADSETRQQVKQKESQRSPVFERKSIRRSKNTHVSDSTVSHSYSRLVPGGDAACGSSSFALARHMSTIEIGE